MRPVDRRGRHLHLAVQAQPVVGDARQRADPAPGQQRDQRRAAAHAQRAQALQHAVHVEGARDRLVAVVGHQQHEVVGVGALEQRPQLAVEQPVDVDHALGHRRLGGGGVVGMAGVHVLEQAVLDAVGRHEDHAGRIPGLLVHQPAHGLGAAAGDVLDVGHQLQRLAPEGRPGAAVDRPAQVGPGLGRVAVGGALRDHAAGDGDALDLGRGIGQRHVHDQAGAAGIGQLRRPGRSQDRTRGDRQPAGGAGPVLEDVEDAVPGRVASGQEGRPGRPGVRRQA